MADPILLAKCQRDLVLLPQLANRHGLVAGATGTGKTVTLQRLAEGFSRIGVPVFMADVKGDLSGICRAATHPNRGCSIASHSQAHGFQPRVPGGVLGRLRRSRATRCAPPSRTWGRCCCAHARPERHAKAC